MWSNTSMWLWSPVKRFERRLRHRERTAYVIREDLRLQRTRHQNLQLATAAVHAAKDDEAIYERLLHQPAPTRLREILSTELLLWMSVRDTLANLTGRDMLPDQYRQAITELRPRLEDLGTLTRLTRVALHRPLTMGEQASLQELEGRYT